MPTKGLCRELGVRYTRSYAGCSLEAFLLITPMVTNPAAFGKMLGIGPLEEGYFPRRLRASFKSTPHKLKSTMAQLLTIWTIRLSLVLFAATVFGWLVDRPLRFKSVWNVTWSVGFLSAVVHVLCAFHFYHDWSVRAAYADTAKQTQELMGISFGAGVYFNYLFLIAWGADVVALWLWPGSFPASLNSVRLVGLWYLAFIAINGAIVFESGPTRVGGIIAVTLLCCAVVVRWHRNACQRNANESTSN
jgi:hypothetical protein